MLDRYVLSNKLSEFWYSCRKFLLFFLLSMIVGIVLGLTSAGNLQGVLSDMDIKDPALSWYLGRRSSIGGYFFISLFEVLVFTVLIVVVNINVYFMAGNYLLIVYKGYLIGYNSLLIMNIFGVSGVFNIFLIYIPQQLIQLLCLICISCWANKRCVENRRSGFWCFRRVEYDCFFRKLIFWMIVFLVCNLLLSLLFGVVSKNSVM